MNEADLVGQPSRSRGAFYTIASTMIAERLHRKQLNFTDLVTIIEFRREAEIIDYIEAEPVTWELYNKVRSFAN